MTPDYERAALLATQTLIQYGINSAPVSPLPVLKRIPGVLVLSFDSMSATIRQDRQCVISAFGESSQDAFTTAFVRDDKLHYIVTYNQHLSNVLIQRALARELGHIVLGHDGSRPEDVRNEEARCFAHHMLCPRPLIHAVQATGLRFTEEVLGNLTGCYHQCLSCMRKMPGVHVPADLNRAVRDQFRDYFLNFFNYQRSAMHADGSAVADLGSYMDYYEE